MYVRMNVKDNITHIVVKHILLGVVLLSNYKATVSIYDLSVTIPISTHTAH
jgi:hypothetical protein